jgi:hypothetical protein
LALLNHPFVLVNTVVSRTKYLRKAMRKPLSLRFRFALAFLGLAAWNSDNAPLGVSASKSQDESADLFYQFVTRPDIAAPKWDVKIYDEDALAPGYWFVAPYKDLKQVSYSAWNGPHIYDGNGELIWSGSPMFQHYNTYDFRATEYDGRHMASLITHVDEAGFIFDSTYQVQKTVNMTSNVPDWAADKLRDERTANMHEFYVIANGSRVLMLTKVFEHTSVEESKTIGFNGNCTAKWEGFKEVDLATGEVLFEWNSHGHIGLDEGTIEPVNLLCSRTLPHGYDSPHENAIDKFDDGDYLLSARYTDTIYKISHRDGSIVWRLGGKKSDFHFKDDEATFKRQHFARVLDQNKTHTVVSMFDNSVGKAANDDVKHARSRGLILALRTDTTPMTAEVVQKFELSERRRIRAKGDLQVLPNDNAFICWSKASELSEHSPDGRVLMEAAFKLRSAGTYRGYKFPWVGQPSAPPDIKSFTHQSDNVRNTTVYVSWNGATEVKTWNVYGTNSSDDDVRLITSAKRQGFETMLTFDGYAETIYVEAVDLRGNFLGRSGTFKTIAPTPEVSHDRSIFLSPIVSIIIALLSCTITILVVLVALSSPERRQLWWPSKAARYAAVAGDEKMEEGKGCAMSEEDDSMFVYPHVK